MSLFANLIIVPGLGDVGWGVWSTAIGLSGATGFVTGLGVRPLFVRALARSTNNHERNRLIGSQLALRLMLAIVASAIAILVGLALGYEPLVLQCAAIASFGLLPTVVWTVYGDVLNAEESFRASAVASLLSGLALTAATIIAVVLRLGPVGVAVAYLIGPLLTALQLATVLRKRGLRVTPAWDGAELRRLVQEAKLTAAGDGVSNLLNRIHGIYIPALIGPVYYGFYATGNLIVSRLQVVGDAVVTAYTPGISRDHAILRRGEPTASSRTMLRLLLVGGIVVGVASLAVSAWFVGLIYRSPSQVLARNNAMVVMVIASLSIPSVLLSMGWRQLLISVDEHDLAARTSAKATLVGVLATATLTWRWGLEGAAIGLVFSGLVGAVLTGIAAGRTVGKVARVPGWPRGLACYLLGGSVAVLAILAGVSLLGAILVLLAPATAVLLTFALRLGSVEEFRRVVGEAFAAVRVAAQGLRGGSS